jgi:hypothetical protein
LTIQAKLRMAEEGCHQFIFLTGYKIGMCSLLQVADASFSKLTEKNKTVEFRNVMGKFSSTSKLWGILLKEIRVKIKDVMFS